jgi:hypothetical protein
MISDYCLKSRTGIVESSIVTLQFRINNEGLRQKEDSMCPACISSAALVASSVMSTGGIAALAVKLGFRKKSRGKKSGPNNNSNNATERKNDDGNNERNHK